MPNWTTNTVTITGAKPVLEKVKELLESKDFVFDFDKIKPMPKSLNIESGGIMTCAMTMASNKPTSAAYKRAKEQIRLPYTMHQMPAGYSAVLTTDADVIAVGKLYLENKEKYGATTWYDWNCDNWGTKWNVSDDVLDSESDTELVYYFNTAWSAPIAVLQTLSKQFPDVLIKLESTYEDDMPYNIYVTEFQKGETSDCGMYVDEEHKADYEETCEECE